MGRLAAFQDGFANALRAVDLPADLPPKIARIADQPGFAVYRNTVMKGWIDALEANFPAVLAIVGDEWFRAAASNYARANPPRLPMMSLYGADFAAFLTRFAPAVDMPYLGPVAAIDRAWTEALAAADAPFLAPEALAGIAPAALGRTRLALHPSARLAWFDTTSPSIWLDARGLEPSGDLTFEERGEGILLVRATDGLTAMRLTGGAHAYLRAIAGGAALGEAAADALTAEPALDLAGLTTTLLQLGAFARFGVPAIEQDHTS